MVPLVEPAFAAEQRKSDQGFRSLAVAARLDERGDLRAADEEPDAAVVILAGMIQVSVVVPPIRLAGLDGRVDGAHRAAVQPVPPDERENVPGLAGIADAGEDCQ